jgi:uncharacterized membrane protein YadS
MRRRGREEPRVNVLIRVIGLIYVIFGILLAVFTSTTNIVSQVVSTYYLISTILIATGILALFAKLERPAR